VKFSIITPSYNSGKFIEATLKSIVAQAGEEVEHIVMDGGSKDDTAVIMARYPHIRFFSEKDKGQSDALNKGFAKCTGEILAWQNADDLYAPGAFGIVSKFFTENPDVDLVYGDYQLIREDGSVLNHVHPIEWSQWFFSHGRFVPLQPTVFWRRKVYETLGDLDLSLHYCMDVDFFCRASKRFKFKKIPAMLGQFRIHQDSKTQNRDNDRKVRAEYHNVLAKHFDYGAWDHIIFKAFELRSAIARIVKGVNKV
jgi:glycosyltransferase involved in cell wall biosynthesis